MTDQPAILTVRDGFGVPRTMVADADPSGNLIVQHVPRVAGAEVGAGNPMPSADAVAGAGIGTPADAAWSGSGSSSLVGALKALWVALAGVLTFKPAGSIGAERSANPPTGPGAGTSFAFNGTTLNLLATIAANPARRGLEVNNTTGGLVVVVLDDGANTAGTVSLFPLAAGAGAFQQGGDFAPPNELGRLRLFGTAGTFCYARET